MFKNIYTTRMSGSGKSLKKRFEKINASHKRWSGLITLVCFGVLMLCFAVTSFAIANVTDEQIPEQKEPVINITNNGEVIELENKIFLEDGIVYVPLREFFTKFGMMETGAYIKWDNGVIIMMLSDKNTMEDAFMTHTGYMYKIEIGKKELVINPEELVPNAKEKGVLFAEEMNAAPILRNNITYVPYEYIYRIVERADNGVLSYPDKYRLDISFEREIFTIQYPFDKYHNITSTFGTRVHPVTGEERFHSGIDIKAAEGTKVLSGFDGKITDAGFDAEKGYYLTLTNGRGIEITYSQLKEFIKQKGDNVIKGEQIGYVGNTGESTGAHLHLELKIYGEYVNPEVYFEKTRELTLTTMIERSMPRWLVRSNFEGYTYEITDIVINDTNDEATVTLVLKKDGDEKSATILCVKHADIWNMLEAVIN